MGTLTLRLTDQEDRDLQLACQQTGKTKPEYAHRKTLQEKTMNDQIITALRATKEKLAEEAGFDIERLIANIQREEQPSAIQGRVVLQPADGKPSGMGFHLIRFANH